VEFLEDNPEKELVIYDFTGHAQHQSVYKIGCLHPHCKFSLLYHFFVDVKDTMRCEVEIRPAQIQKGYHDHNQSLAMGTVKNYQFGFGSCQNVFN
jgi:hypothetical protein